MLNKMKKTLFSEKVPTIICAMACIVSLMMGFTLGYLFTVQGEYYVAYAEAAPPNQSPFVAVIPETQPPPTETPPPEPEQHLYIVTTTNGYLAIYHSENNGGGLKELTTTTVCALPREEQEALKAGIRIYTEEALVRLLQDYGS